MIGVNNLQNSKLTDDVCLDHGFHLFFRYGDQGFCFHPLCEIVYSYEKEFSLAHGLWERSQNVQPLLSKWNWLEDSLKL